MMSSTNNNNNNNTNSNRTPDHVMQTMPASIDLLSDTDIKNNGSNNNNNNNNNNTAGDHQVSAMESNAPYVAMETEKIGKNKDDDDDDDDNVSLSSSIVSSVLTKEGIHDWTGFVCVCFVVLIGDMSRGVMFPSMWPLVEKLGGSSVLLGYSVASFSFGRVLVNPLFGSWSHQIGYGKTLCISCCILFFGTLVYAQIENIGKPEFLIVAQTLLGIGSGTLGVTRAYIAEVTAQRQRTTYMAWVTAVQYAGFTVTPFFGALFNFVFANREYSFGIFRLNMFTAPAYFMTVIVAGVLYALVYHFPDRPRLIATSSKKSAKRQTIEDFAQSRTLVGLSIYDCCILGCMLLNVSTKGSIASFETMGIAVAQSHFDMLASRAAVIVASCGACGVVSLLSMGHFSAYFSDIQLICGGMGIMSLGIASLMTIEETFMNPSWRYCLAMFLIYAIGYPIGHTAVIGLFSKIVGRRPQGTLLGWFASAGSIARMFFPILSGYIATYRDVQTLFVLLTVVLIISTVFVVLSRHTLTLLSS